MYFFGLFSSQGSILVTFFDDYFFTIFSQYSSGHQFFHYFFLGTVLVTIFLQNFSSLIILCFPEVGWNFTSQLYLSLRKKRIGWEHQSIFCFFPVFRKLFVFFSLTQDGWKRTDGFTWFPSRSVPSPGYGNTSFTSTWSSEGHGCCWQ